MLFTRPDKKKREKTSRVNRQPETPEIYTVLRKIRSWSIQIPDMASKIQACVFSELRSGIPPARRKPSPHPAPPVNGRRALRMGILLRSNMERDPFFYILCVCLKNICYSFHFFEPFMEKRVLYTRTHIHP
jgi:hypothetical protein